MATTPLGIFALLDLPQGSSLCVDGRSITLKRDDFISLTHIPLTRTHLFTVHAASSRRNEQDNSGYSPIVVGFFFSFSEQNPYLVRGFDPMTEEISAVSIDQTTTDNLIHAIQENQLEPGRTLRYDQIVTTEASHEWHWLSSFLTKSFLNFRGIKWSDKIVPDAYQGDPGENETGEHSLTSDGPVDGIAIKYPAVAVLNESHQGAEAASARLKATDHGGTKSFLMKLPPAERTALFVHKNRNNRILDYLLSQEYHGNWDLILGDVQLAFLLFLHIHCYGSLCHWRDLVALLCQVDATKVRANLSFYESFLRILACQTKVMEPDLVEDTNQYQGSFFVPAIRTLVRHFSNIDTSDVSVRASLAALSNLVASRGFVSVGNGEGSDDIGEMAEDFIELDDDHDGDDEGGDDGEDDSGPVVVSTSEVDLSMERIAASKRTMGDRQFLPEHEYPRSDRDRFPILFAAMTPNEDILMTCSRALDVASDVSLVREAAAYLQEVEANRKAEYRVDDADVMTS